VHDREVLLRGREQKIRGITHGVAVFQMMKFRDHGSAHGDPVGQRPAGGRGAFLGGTQPDEEGEKYQHEFARH